MISGHSVIAFGNHVGASYLALDTPDLVFDRDGLTMSAKWLSHSASIAVYRPQADVFGGRFDGKFAVR